MQQPAATAPTSQGRLTYFLANAPYSVIASALPGFVNYAIILFLVNSSGFAAAGSYRLVLSIHGLIGLAAMMETGKIYIRSITTGEREALPALWINRLIFASLPVIMLSIGFVANQYFQLWLVSENWIWIASACAVIYIFDFYKPHLQAVGKFPTLLAIETLKYGFSALVFLIALEQQISPERAALFMLVVVAGANIALSLALVGTTFLFPKSLSQALAEIRSGPARQARIYSFANLLSASLDHFDKFLVGLVFGLEWLGIYALAFSTGRLIYNALKPALYIYFRRFVDRMPTAILLWRIGILGTFFGLTCAAIFCALVLSWPAMENFEAGATITIILFCGYGFGLVRATYSQAFALNRDSRSHHAWRASLYTFLVLIPLVGLALLLPPAIALIILAILYPIRDALNVILLGKFRHARG